MTAENREQNGVKPMETILSYLQERYQPLTVILYGSYADGSNNQNSDFDALLVTADGNMYHDVSVVDGVQLDVFVYPLSELNEGTQACEFAQIFDGTILADTDGIGCALKNKALDYVNDIPKKTAEEIRDEIAWCKKMLARVERDDAEGYYRWHWLLTDSLEIACDILQHPYCGPKKSLRWLEGNSLYLYETYHEALKEMNVDALKKWVDCLVELSSKGHVEQNTIG